MSTYVKQKTASLLDVEFASRLTFDEHLSIYAKLETFRKISALVRVTPFIMNISK